MNWPCDCINHFPHRLRSCGRVAAKRCVTCGAFLCSECIADGHHEHDTLVVIEDLPTIGTPT